MMDHSAPMNNTQHWLHIKAGVYIPPVWIYLPKRSLPKTRMLVFDLSEGEGGLLSADISGQAANAGEYMIQEQDGGERERASGDVDEV